MKKLGPDEVTLAKGLIRAAVVLYDGLVAESADVAV